MIIDGKEIAAEIQKTVREKILNLKKRKVGLAFLLVGSHPASQSYVRGKQKACVATGIESTLVELPEDTSQKELLKQIDKLNQNDAIDGILVQLPLPPQIDPKIITSAIDPEKDVDGFHPMNVGKMLLGEEGGFLPCTPHGIQVMLEKSHTPVEGKHVVILGRSNLVGKPLAAILMQKRKGCNATVTVAHGKSEKLPEITRSADILVAAIGQPRLITADMVKPGAVVIDVGINRLDNGKLVGDVDFETVKQKASKITPVPGGVGPMTIAMLLQNTLWSHLKRYEPIPLF